jgi:hypothetical protein
MKETIRLTESDLTKIVKQIPGETLEQKASYVESLTTEQIAENFKSGLITEQEVLAIAGTDRASRFVGFRDDLREAGLPDVAKMLGKVFEMPEDKLDVYVPELYNIMCLTDVLQGIFKWPVPLTLDAEYGDTWHVDHDLFKEKPHLKTAADPIVFHQPTQVLETAAPVVEEPSTAVLMGESVHEAPVLTQEITIGTPDGLSTPESTQNLEVPQESQSPEGEEDLGVIQYELKDLNEVTALKYNAMVSLLTKECDNKIYGGPIKLLKVYDKDGTLLTVSNLKVRADSFFIMAKTFGL